MTSAVISTRNLSPARLSFAEWIAEHALGLAAGVAWIGTIAGLALERAADRPSLALLLYIVAYIAGGTIATRDALLDLRHGHVNIDLLMVLAAAGAAVLGQWLEGAILLSLFSTSNALEQMTMARTQNAVRALMNLTPQTGHVLRHGNIETVPVGEIKLGETVMVQPGERVPVDGSILEGRSALDQSALTGESVPVEKSVGDEVFSGTINGNGSLRVRATRLADDSALARIVRMVSDARKDQSELQQFAEGFEGKYAVFVIAFSLLVTVVPILFGESGSDAFYRGMTLLVVMSPCALVISTPAATLSALANAARRGIIVKGGRAMDVLGSVDTVAFDKTGTLTIGRPVLTDLVTLGSIDAPSLLAMTAAAEALSEHPIGEAIVAAAQRDGLTMPPARDLEAVPGHGILAEVDGAPIAIGNSRLMEAQGYRIPQAALDHQLALSDAGKSTMFVAHGEAVVGLIAVADTVRPEVGAMLRELKRLGVKRTVMLTGDNQRVAAAIAEQVGIDDVRADLLPEDKLKAIGALRAQGKVAMIGDGVNDAPALASADIGIAMGGVGSDASLETADVILASDDLARVGYAIGLSRKMRRIITMNLTFAIGVIVVLTVANLLVGIPLPLGVVGHEGSTVIVILNGLRLLGYGGNWGELMRRAPESAPPAAPAYTVTSLASA